MSDVPATAFATTTAIAPDTAAPPAGTPSIMPDIPDSKHRNCRPHDPAYLYVTAGIVTDSSDLESSCTKEPHTLNEQHLVS